METKTVQQKKSKLQNWFRKIGPKHKTGLQKYTRT